MSNIDQLAAIQQEKRDLKLKLQQLSEVKPQGGDTSQSTLDTNMMRLLQRKKILEDKKKEQEKYKKMEAEYIERRKQVERQKQLQRIKNQKRILELEAGMKRIVFEGLKEKVKGMNSDQLMMRGYLAQGGNNQGEGDNHETSPTSSSNPFKFNRNQSTTIREQFKEYLMKENPVKLKPIYDIHNLNQKRLELYEQKEQAVMRELLLKQLTALDQPPEIDVMRLDRRELEEELARLGVSHEIEEFMHPVKKQDIISHYPAMEEASKMRIQEKKKVLEERRKGEEEAVEERKRLREEVSRMKLSSVEPMRGLLYEVIDQIVAEYEKRHTKRTKEDLEERGAMLSKEYQALFLRNFINEFSNDTVDDMLERVRKEMVAQSAEEIHQLHQFAHQKIQACFEGILSYQPQSLAPKLQSLAAYNIPLNFTSSTMSAQLRNAQYLSKFNENEQNIYQTQTSTTPMLHDISFLDMEEKYFQQIVVSFQKDSELHNEEVFLYENGTLYGAGRYGIRDIQRDKIVFQGNGGGLMNLNSSSNRKTLESMKKYHGCWLLQGADSILMITRWNREELKSAIGSRISNPCGQILQCEFSPILTLLGSPCGLLMGFKNGQILKYNLNFNRITSIQTSITHYLPILQSVKTGDQPGFPLENRNQIQVQPTRGKGQMHQFREFFQHHQTSVVFLGYYKYNQFITMDKTMKCALWQYDKKRGGMCYVPVYKFEIKSTYFTYKEDENPRFKDIYPANPKKDPSPEDAYEKYMQTEEFLKRQLYNNPKKQIAYFKAESWEEEGQDCRPIWKITYDDKKRRVDKILQSYYNATQGNVEAKAGKLWKGKMVFLCERQHILRHDLKTIKIYSWEISSRKLSRIGLQMDMYKDQKVNDFVILPGMQLGLGLDLQVMAIVSSGRILIFSLLSGQLLKNITQQQPPQSKYAKYYFRSLVNAFDKSFFYAMTSTRVVQVSFQDQNSAGNKTKLANSIELTKRKYLE